MPITSSNSVTLEGSYELAQFIVQKSAIPPIAGTQLTAKFEGNRVIGNGGINGYNASYEASKDTPPSTLLISNLNHTKKDGPQDVVNQERRFFDGLCAARDVTYGDGTISLTWDKAQASLVFRRL